MAILLWTVPRFEGQTSKVLEDIPVRVQLTDPNWAQVGKPSPSTVSVTISGPTRELLAIGVDRPPVLVPMDEVSAGDTTVLLRTSWFRGSSREGVVVEELRPQAVSLAFEEIVQRPFPLAPAFFGEPPPGVSLAGPPRMEPEAVVVFGPGSRLQDLDTLAILPIDLSMAGSQERFRGVVDTTGLGGLNVHPPEVMVEVPTEPTFARELPEQAVELPELPSDPQLQVQPSEVKVVLVGARSLVDSVDPGALAVTIPSSRASLSPGQEERVLLVVEGVPELVEARVTPEWVSVRRPVGR
jgi:YbbR domain-containing protein